MAEYNFFIGREKQLAQIEKLIASQKEALDNKTATAPLKQLIFIEEEGGIGKTFFLRKIKALYDKRPGFKVDFYDLSESPPGDWREAQRIVQTVGKDNFPEFNRRFKQLVQGKIDITAPDFEQKKNEVFQIGAKELENALGNRLLIRIVDTLDMEIPDYIWEKDRFCRFLAVPNVLLIVAGRKAEKGVQRLQQGFNTTRITLGPFSQDETDDFFEKITFEGKTGKIIPLEMRQKIHFLTEGRPVLLSLAVEWYFRNLPLPESMELPLQEIKRLPEDALNELRTAFKIDLIDGIRSLDNTLAGPLLYLALVDRRGNKEILRSLMGISPTEAQDLIKRLIKVPFIKSGKQADGQEPECCLLHDEVKHLINTYVWPPLDISGDTRKKVLRKIVNDYYQKQINEIHNTLNAQQEEASKYLAETSQKEWELWQLEAEALHYLLQIDEKESFERYETWFEDARLRNQDIRMELLRYEMEGITDPAIRDAIALDEVDILRRRGKFIEAKEICENLLRKADLSQENRISAYIGLGWVKANTKPREAIQEFTHALEIAQEIGDINKVAIINNNIGQMYRRLYEHDKAIASFEKAIENAREAKNKTLMVAAWNNLAYEYRQEGELDRAKLYCQSALKERKKQGLKKDLAYSYLTLAEINLEEGNYPNVANNTKIALDLFEQSRDKEGQIWVFRVLSLAARYQSNHEDADKFLHKAIAMAREINNLNMLADLYNVYGRNKRAIAEELLATSTQQLMQRHVDTLLTDAKRFLTKSITYAQQSGHQWILARSKFELAMIYYLYSKEIHDIQKANNLLNFVLLEGPKSNIFIGHVKEMQALISIKQEDYQRSGRLFGEAIRLLRKTGGRVPKLFQERMERLLFDNMPYGSSIALSDKKVIIIARGILQSIAPNIEENEFVDFMIQLCKNAITLSEIF